MKNKSVGKKRILLETKINTVIRHTTIYNNFLIKSFIGSLEISDVHAVNQDSFEYIAN